MDAAQKTHHGHGTLRRSMGRFVRWLRACRHDWSIIGINGFGSPSEETCIKCGEYRHRIHDHRIMGREEWKPGRHPKSKMKEIPHKAPEIGFVFRNGDTGECTVTKVWESRFGDWKVSYADKRGGGGMMNLGYFIERFGTVTTEHNFTVQEQWHPDEAPVERRPDQPDSCRECGAWMPCCGYAPLCEWCISKSSPPNTGAQATQPDKHQTTKGT